VEPARDQLTNRGFAGSSTSTSCTRIATTSSSRWRARARSRHRRFDPRSSASPWRCTRLESHFDLRRAYNPTTGEEMNVLTENARTSAGTSASTCASTGRRNLSRRTCSHPRALREFRLLPPRAGGLPARSGLGLPGVVEAPVPAHELRRLGRLRRGCQEQDREHAGDYTKDELYYMSFVNQEIFTPATCPIRTAVGLVPWCYSILQRRASVHLERRDDAATRSSRRSPLPRSTIRSTTRTRPITATSRTSGTSVPCSTRARTGRSAA